MPQLPRRRRGCAPVPRADPPGAGSRVLTLGVVQGLPWNTPYRRAPARRRSRRESRGHMRALPPGGGLALRRLRARQGRCGWGKGRTRLPDLSRASAHTRTRDRSGRAEARAGEALPVVPSRRPGGPVQDGAHGGVHCGLREECPRLGARERQRGGRQLCGLSWQPRHEAWRRSRLAGEQGAHP